MSGLYQKLLFVLVLVETSQGVEAPYIISAAPQSSRTVSITWRNNDLNAESFVLYKKQSTEESYINAGTQSKNSSVYMFDNLIPGTEYSFVMRAFIGTDSSVFSNVIIASTKPGDFATPKLSLFYDSVQTKVILTILDRSEIEAGYEVFKSVGNETNAKPFAKIQSVNPGDTQTIIREDKDVHSNEWYQYVVKAIVVDSLWKSTRDTTYPNNLDSLSSIKTIFTLVCGDLASYNDSILVLKDKKSEFPIKFNGWSMKIGDNIILAEKEIGDSSYSIIKVSNPSSPAFGGVVKTSYLINAGCGYATGDRLFCKNQANNWNDSNPTVASYEFLNGSLNIKQVFYSNAKKVYNSNPQIDGIFGLVDDSLLIFSATCEGTHSIAQLLKANTRSERIQGEVIGVFGEDNARGSRPIILNNNMYYYFNHYYMVGQVQRIQNVDGLIYDSERIQFISSIPCQVGLYKTFDSTIKNSKNIICDPIKNVAYIFTDTILSTYSYSVCSYQDFLKVNLIGNSSKKVVSARSSVLVNNRVEISDMLGRRVSRQRGNGNGRNRLLNTNEFCNSMVVVKAGRTILKKVLVK